ncbi:hypothetical protein M422DRAFT_271770 [Sphaerobolus stellatus SS14]|uniref:MULE transposase domain-containing protein n=1 Tax=Sphaerobolus stellatus (strain SS14) TaxID=990650 RepID=A0A0C9UD79_SPHS4|nr:hypothetical protein M422DRAFT_271770 [Sphaerobolus stellatus SS14]
MKSLRDQYQVNPKFIHTDKDLAEIKAAQAVWVSAKHQLCWWHVRKAVRPCLEKDRLSTSAYNVHISHTEFEFIDLEFIPRRQDGRPTAKAKAKNQLVEPLITQSSWPNALKVTIKIPDGFNFNMVAELEGSASGTEDESMDIAEEEFIEGSNGLFFPEIYHDLIINMMEHHFCAHLLIPGFSAPTSEGIRYWAVKEMYDFCVKHDLTFCWAYLWENWYNWSSWKLWARAECEEIAILKTTMICESQ